MSNNDSQQLTNELVEKIQQFLTYQTENNDSLSEAAKESLTVANECIDQAYRIQRRPASQELLDIYRSHKEQPRARPETTGQNPPSLAGLLDGTNPAAFLQNIASTLMTQAGGQAPPSGTSEGPTAQPNSSVPPFDGANPAAYLQNLASSILTQATASPAAGATGQPPSSSSASSESAATQQQTQASSTTAPPRPKKVRGKASEAERIAAESFKNQGNDFMKLDKYKEAHDCYTKAIEIDDNNAIYYSNRAAASSKLGDHQAALNDCQEAVEIDPNYSKAYGRMGLAYASMEDHQRAKEAYVKAVELDPNNESYRNNLKIAEEKLADASGAGGAGAAGGPQGANMMSMLRSVMNNPEIMQMAMRSLQDPRIQNMFNMGGGGGAGAGGHQQQPPPGTC